MTGTGYTGNRGFGRDESLLGREHKDEVRLIGELAGPARAGNPFVERRKPTYAVPQ